MNTQWINALTRMVIAVVISLLVARFAQPWMGWLCLVAALTWQLLFHLHYLARLDRWSAAPTVDPDLEGEGAWDGVFRRLYRHEKDLRHQIAAREHEVSLLLAAGQALTDGIVLLDRHERIVYCNRTAEEQLGLRGVSDHGSPLVNLVRLPEFAAYLAEANFAQPLILALERGQERVLSISVVPYVGGRQLMQIKDVTQSDRLERMRRDFVANVSHELRTPLTVLSGFLETLLEIELEPDIRKRYLGLMAEQSSRMEIIVQDLLTLSAMESAPPPSSAVVDMVAMMERLQRDARALSGGRHTIAFESHGQGDLYGSEAELLSAFTNLVSNAVRYTPEGGTITLEWQVNTDGAEFAVRDSGIGIAPEHVPRLTERFYRVDRGRSRDVGGTGLGLAIVKHALSRHQAVLFVTSKQGEGSRFSARFPLERVATFDKFLKKI